MPVEAVIPVNLNLRDVLPPGGDTFCLNLRSRFSMLFSPSVSGLVRTDLSTVRLAFSEVASLPNLPSLNANAH